MKALYTALCGLLLAAGARAVTASRAPIVKDGATLDAEGIWLENEVVKVAIVSNHLAGQVMSFVYKPTGHELAAEKHPQGYCMDRTGENRFFWQQEAEGYAGEIVSLGEAAVVARTSYRWNYAHNDVKTQLRVSKTFTLRRGSAALEVLWRFENIGHAEVQFSPWVKHLGGSYEQVLSGPTVMLFADGPRDPGGEFVEPTTDWVARLSGTETTADLPMVVSTMDYGKIFQQFPWRGKERFTLETILARTHLKPGESWEITYVLGAMANLGNPTWACPELAAEIERQGDQAVVRLSPAVHLGERRIEGELLAADGTLIAKLPNLQANLVPGTIATLTYPFTPKADGIYHFSLTVFDDGQQPIRLGRTVNAQQSSISLPLAVGPAPAVVYTKWQSGGFTWPTRQPRTVTPWRVLLATPAMKAAQVRVPNRIFPEDTLDYAAAAQPALLQLARNEYGNVQIVVETAEPALATQLRVAVEAPPGLTVALREAVYLTTETPSGYKNFPVGQWPDPLFAPDWLERIPKAPVAKINRAAIERTGRRVFWLIVKAPPEAQAGRVSGKLRLALPGQPEEAIPFEVEVWDFALPKRPALRCSTGMVGFSQAKWRNTLTAMGVAKDEQERLAAETPIMDRYRTLVLEYGWTPTMFGGLKFWQQYHDVGRGVNVFATGKDKAAEAWLKERDLLKYAFVYAPFDEHADVVVPEVAAWARQWKAESDIPILDCFYGTNVEPLFGLVDIWLGQSPKQPWAKARKEAGDLFFAVNSSLVWHVEFDPTNGRAALWQDFADGVDGRYVYSTCRWTDDVYLKNWTSGNYMGNVVYPSPDGICTSIRLETMRDGVEDYDYLALLRQAVADAGAKAPAAALTEARELLADDQLGSRIASTDDLHRLRQRVAELILALAP